MLNESLLERELKRLNLKWLQADRKYRWMLTYEQDLPYIKRNVKIASSGRKTFQRLPRKIYKELPKQEMQDLLTRLNHQEDREQRMRERFKVNSAFIPNQYLEEFYELLENEIPTLEIAKANYSTLKKHFLDYFTLIGPDPTDWHRQHQVKWAKYLFKTELSPKGIRSIIQISNRFMKFLHKKRPNEIPLMNFQPISKARFKFYTNEWKQSEKCRKRNYISELDYHKILRNIPEDIKSVFILCYKFGLRRGEAMGLIGRLDCVRKDYIFINKQLTKLSHNQEAVLGPTKSRMDRKVPYWNAEAPEAYELISKLVPMRPDECSRQFGEYCKSINLNCTLHDCRHTFITNAVNKKGSELNTIKLAVGHRDLRVTSGYLRDHTDYDGEVWVPDTDSKAS